MIVRNATDADIGVVVMGMRADDAYEVYNDRWDKTPTLLIGDLIRCRAMALGQLALCRDDGFPVAILGAILIAPARAYVQMIATDRWPDIAAAATRYSIRTAIPVYLDGVRRSECRCWEGNSVSRAWLERLGYVCEARMPQHGTDGSTYLLYARIHPKFRQDGSAQDGWPRRSGNREGNSGEGQDGAASHA